MRSAASHERGAPGSAPGVPFWRSMRARQALLAASLVAVTTVTLTLAGFFFVRRLILSGTRDGLQAAARAGRESIRAWVRRQEERVALVASRTRLRELIAARQRGELELERRPFPLSDTVAGALQAFSISAEEKGVEPAFHAAPGTPEWVVGDPGRLLQIVVNLVGNAIKLTERGEIGVESELGAGSTFWFTARLARASRRGRGRRPGGSSPWGATGFWRKLPARCASSRRSWSGWPRLCGRFEERGMAKRGKGGERSVSVRWSSR